MGYEIDAKGLVLRIVNALVDDVEEVKLTSIESETETMFEVTVALTDVGKIIGKQGRTARAIRELLWAMGVVANKRYGLDIVETGSKAVAWPTLGFLSAFSIHDFSVASLMIRAAAWFTSSRVFFFEVRDCLVLDECIVHLAGLG